jgi:hypothetical protein
MYFIYMSRFIFIYLNIEKNLLKRLIIAKTTYILGQRE